MKEKLTYAAMMADEMWDKYMKSPEPAKRHLYALRYCFWKGIVEANELPNKQHEPPQEY